MGLLRAGIVGVIGVVTIEFIKSKEKLISKNEAILTADVVLPTPPF